MRVLLIFVHLSFSSFEFSSFWESVGSPNIIKFQDLTFWHLTSDIVEIWHLDIKELLFHRKELKEGQKNNPPPGNFCVGGGEKRRVHRNPHPKKTPYTKFQGVPRWGLANARPYYKIMTKWPKINSFFTRLFLCFN